MKKTLITAAAGLFFSSLAMADMTLTYAKPDGFVPLVIKVSGNKVIYENNGDYGKTTSIIDLETGETATIMHAQKMVMTQNKKSAKARAKRIAEMKEKSKGNLDKMLSLLPKDQQIAANLVVWSIKAGMNALLEANDIDTVSVIQTDVEKTVNGKTCKILETRFDDKLATASCMVPASEYGIDQMDMERSYTASFYMAYLASQSTAALNPNLVANLKTSKFEGIAIEMDQKLHNLGLWTLKDANADPVPAEAFEIPKGYKEMKM